MAAVHDGLSLSEARALAVRDPSALFSEIVGCFGKNESFFLPTPLGLRREPYDDLVFLMHGTGVYTKVGHSVKQGEDFVTLGVPSEVRRAILGNMPSSIDDFLLKLNRLTGGKGEVNVGYIFPNPQRFELAQAYVGTPQAATYESPVSISAKLYYTHAPIGLTNFTFSAHLQVQPADLAKEASLVGRELLVPGKESVSQERRLSLPQLLNLYVQEYYVPNLKGLAKR